MDRLMAARMTLLVLVTGLFAAVWSSDRPPSDEKLAVARSKAPRVSSVRQTPLRRWSTSGIPRSNAAWEPIVAAIRPPQVLPPGNYIVVDERGHVERVEIPESKAAPPFAFQDRVDHFVCETDTGRRHWVRIASPASLTRRGDDSAR